MYRNVWQDDKGFSLIEVLIAVTVVSVAILGLLSIVGSTMKAVEVGKRQTQAVNLAAGRLEMLKAVPAKNIQSTGTDGAVARTCNGASPTFTCIPTTPVITIGNADYTWWWKVTYVDLDGDSNYEEDGAADGRDIKRIDVSVSWTDLVGSHETTLAILM